MDSNPLVSFFVDIVAPMESGSPLRFDIKAPMESGSPLHFDIKVQSKPV